MSDQVYSPTPGPGGRDEEHGGGGAAWSNIQERERLLVDHEARLQQMEQRLLAAYDDTSDTAADTASCGDVDKAAPSKADDDSPQKGNEPEMENALKDEIYTLLYIAPIGSAAFIYAFFVMCFQLTLLVVILVETIGFSGRIDIPAATAPTVAIAQGMCVLVSATLDREISQAVASIEVGPPISSNVMAQEFGLPDASPARFWMTKFVKLFMGIFLILIRNLLLLQEKTVMNVFWANSAFGFLLLMGDLGYRMGAQGFVLQSIQAMCEKSKEVKKPVNKQYACRRCAFLAVLAVLLGGYGVLIAKQARGDFLCQKIFAQFGDEFRSRYSGLSGEYVQTGKYKFAGRVVYLEVATLDRPQQSMLAYCGKEEAWTHSTFGGGSGPPDPCNWNLKSPGRAEISYDILDVADQLWEVYSGGTVHTLHRMYMVCNDCKGGDRGNCQPSHGTCVNNFCQCHAGRYGHNCVFQDPCPLMELDRSAPEFPISSQEDAVGDTYELLRLQEIGNTADPGDDDTNEEANDNFLRFQRHPVYIHSSEDYSSVDIVMFIGRRWIVTNDLLLRQSFTGHADIVEFLTSKFHAVYSEYGYKLSSRYMDVGTASYRGTPVAVNWFEVPWRAMNGTGFDPDVNRAQALDAVFVCAACDDLGNPCRNGHMCDPLQRTCACRKGYHGALCEGVEHCHATKAPCEHAGVCQLDGKCTCSAIPGEPESASRYYGAFCEFDSFEGHLEWRRGSDKWHNLSSECGCSDTLQVEYRGAVNVTKSGLPCQKWDAHDPNEHIFTAENFPMAGLEENYCRNPANFEAASCYTMDDNITFEECAVPECPPSACPLLEETCGCAITNQIEYRGTISVTKSGLKCQKWDTQAPHGHPQVTPELFPEDGLDENYCRNPGGEMERAWCYTQNEDVLYEECDIPACPLSTCPED